MYLLCLCLCVDSRTFGVFIIYVCMYAESFPILMLFLSTCQILLALAFHNNKTRSRVCVCVRVRVHR